MGHWEVPGAVAAGKLGEIHCPRVKAAPSLCTCFIVAKTSCTGFSWQTQLLKLSYQKDSREKSWRWASP